MNRITLDAGALIALERNDRKIIALLKRAPREHVAVAVPAGVIGQVWRDGRRQARLARLLATPEVEIVPLDEERARLAGQLCGASGTSDVIDASVVLCARDRGGAIATSDPVDMLRLDPDLEIEIV